MRIINATDPQGQSADLVLAQLSRAPTIQSAFVPRPWSETFDFVRIFALKFRWRLDAVLSPMRTPR